MITPGALPMPPAEEMRQIAPIFGRLVRHHAGERALVVVGAFAGYQALAQCGYELVGSSSGIASFWPPNGLIIALLVLLPARSRLWVLLAVLPSELLADATQGYSPLTALGWGTANIAESVLAAWILVRVAGRRPLGERARDFVALAVAALSAPLVGALLGGAVSAAEFGGPYGTAWLDWWLGDATGILLVVPLVIAFASPGRPVSARRSLLPFVELALVVGTTLALFEVESLPLEFLLLPPLILLAARHGLKLTATASLLAAVIATICTGRGLGPLSHFGDAGSRLIGLQAFIMTTAFVAYFIYATLAERHAAEAALNELATHDPLTGIANRRTFMERLEQVAARSARSSEHAAVVYFDLDGFKEINDALGHLAGDAVLVETAMRLRGAVRAGDLVARLGGDEFAALLEPVDGIDGAEASARRIADSIEQPFIFNEIEIPIRISLGAALADADCEQALAEADAGLYRDKRRRSTRHVVATA